MVELLPFTSATYPGVTYNKVPVRVVLLDGEVWWDTARMFRFVNKRVNEKLLATFDPHELGWHHFDGEDEPLHVTTTRGALTIVSQLPWKANTMAYTYLRKKHGVLTAPQGVEPVRMPLVMMADGSMPPFPGDGDGRAEWNKLDEARRAALPVVEPPARGPSAKLQPLPPLPTLSSFDPSPDVRRRVDELGLTYRRQLLEAHQAREARAATPLNLADFSQ